MNFSDKSQTRPNQSKLYYVGLGVLLGIGVFFAIRDYQYRNSGIIVHLPVIESR